MNPNFYDQDDPILSREDAIAILDTPDEKLDDLIARAEGLRRKYKGNRVSIHILTNARSGNCSQDCAYCAQSCRSKADIEKYKWVDEEKLYHDNDFVNEHHLSRHCIGLSGMKFTDAEIEELARRIRKMKEQGTHLCCSIGFLTEKQAKMLKDAGLDRDTVIEKLQAQQIQTRPVWALIHEQADYPRNEAYGLDKALDYRKYIVNLPCSTNLSMEDCDRVIEAVLGLLK